MDPAAPYRELVSACELVTRRVVMILPRRTNEAASLRGAQRRGVLREGSLRYSTSFRPPAAAESVPRAGFSHDQWSKLPSAVGYRRWPRRSRAVGASPRREILRAEGALNDMSTLVVPRYILRHTVSRISNTHRAPPAHFSNSHASVSPPSAMGAYVPSPHN